MLTVPLLAAAIDSWPLPFYRFCPPIILFHPLPSSSMQEVRLPIRLQDKKTFFFLTFLSQLLFCSCVFVHLPFCIYVCASFFSSVCCISPYYLPISTCIDLFVSTVCLYSYLLYYMCLYVFASLHLCIIHIFTLQTPHLCLCLLVCIYLRQSCLIVHILK